VGAATMGELLPVRHAFLHSSSFVMCTMNVMHAMHGTLPLFGSAANLVGLRLQSLSTSLGALTCRLEVTKANQKCVPPFPPNLC
jgi:hypothetical protein